MNIIKKQEKTKRKKGLFGRDNLVYDFMALPGMLCVIIFSYIPMLGLVIAFQDYKYNKGIFGSKLIGFKNFEFFFTSQDAGRILKNTLVLNLSFIFVGIFFAVVFALLLFQISSRKTLKVYQTIMILPHFLSWVVVGCMAYAFLSPSLGILNSFLEKIGVEAVDWYSKPEYWPFILGFFRVWKHLGLDCVIYYAGLMSIDNSLFEAAELEGASRFQKNWYICIPEIVPLICTMTLLALGGIFRADFGLFYQITRDIAILYPTTDVIDTYIFRALKTNGDVGMSAAVGFFQSVVGFCTIMIANGIVKKIEKQNALF